MKEIYTKFILRKLIFYYMEYDLHFDSFCGAPPLIRIRSVVGRKWPQIGDRTALYFYSSTFIFWLLILLLQNWENKSFFTPFCVVGDSINVKMVKKNLYHSMQIQIWAHSWWWDFISDIIFSWKVLSLIFI